jgi:hypothetical protein
MAGLVPAIDVLQAVRAWADEKCDAGTPRRADELPSEQSEHVEPAIHQRDEQHDNHASNQDFLAALAPFPDLSD